MLFAFFDGFQKFFICEVRSLFIQFPERIRCKTVAEDAKITSSSDVDQLCSDLFFMHRAQERDDNLLFVRERILRSEADIAGLLELYRQVRRGKRVNDDESNELVTILRLSGITRAES